MTAYKLQKSIEMDNFVTSSAANGGPRGMRARGGGVIGEGCGRSARGHVSSEQSERGRVLVV